MLLARLSLLVFLFALIICFGYAENGEDDYEAQGDECFTCRNGLINKILELLSSLLSVSEAPTEQIPSSKCPFPKVPTCTPSKYRPIDGRCNNLKNPTWGMPGTPYNRLLQAKYADGLYKPRVSTTGKSLPSARLVSQVMHPVPDEPVLDTEQNALVAAFGQWIAHDIADKIGDPPSPTCCTIDGKIDDTDPFCFPIKVPPGDPIYGNRTCLNSRRSANDVDLGCSPPNKPRDQLVRVTHYLDASVIYGNSIDVLATIREGSGGRLKEEQRFGFSWPPSVPNRKAVCPLQKSNDPCYNFGDGPRGNQNLHLVMVEIIWFRVHNWIADSLAKLNPHWDDETIFQKARELLIAILQQITYYEYLPLILGKYNMMENNLIYETNETVKDYRKHVKPHVLTEFSTAAFRYFHTSVAGMIKFVGKDLKVLAQASLNEFTIAPKVIEERKENFVKILCGMTTQGQDLNDDLMSKEVNGFLFNKNIKDIGLDVAALDIHRGRDHGMPTYNDLRELFGLPRARKFEDFRDVIAPRFIEKIKRLYLVPDDVDLMVGGSVERHVENAQVGPVFWGILIEQFYRTRVADRYFFEGGVFTSGQLKEIKKVTIAWVLCIAGNGITEIQREAFKLISKTNKPVPCWKILAEQDLNLSLWKVKL